jgi:CBS-domain-containing membrane protein
VASILLLPDPPPDYRIANGQNSVTSKKNRLKEIQEQLDILMDELHRIRHRIDDQESRRRIYPFPFERAIAPDATPPATKKRVRRKKD